ncbi:hypothetical protein [Paenibacillus dokdonensis]|uniref:hypothetical protein n=1 Tax=Paenibacillus dokdonensis TaxID=2567944 RepID=UPI0010A7BF3F|nr:hypothetical protein [Paenibacillus dokdonensis]
MKKMILSIAIVTAGLAFFYIFFIDGTYRTAVQAIEKARNLDEPIEVVQEQKKGDGDVVFYLRYIHRRNPRPVISVDYTSRALMGWRWVTGGGHTMMETDEAMAEQERLDAQWSVQWLPGEDETPFPLLFGAVVNPDIASVTVTDAKTATTETAVMIDAGKDLRIWYLFVDESLGMDFTLHALSAEGDVLSTQQLNGKPLHTGTMAREDTLK